MDAPQRQPQNEEFWTPADHDRAEAWLYRFFAEQVAAIRREVEVALVEREKAASALSHETERAAGIADAEREKSAVALRETLRESMRVGDDNLRQHILSQRESIQQALDASQQAISKAEMANEKRFEGVNEFRGQLRDQQSTFLPRELFDQSKADDRGRQDAQAARLETLANRLTVMEASNLTRKDATVDTRAVLTLALGGIALLASIAIALLH